MFHFYYNHVALHVVIFRLAYSYGTIFCDLMDTYFDEHA